MSQIEELNVEGIKPQPLIQLYKLSYKMLVAIFDLLSLYKNNLPDV